MKRFAVIGDPIEHSKSPKIYNALFEKHGIDAEFFKLRVRLEDLPDIKEIVSPLSGFAVTMPLKRAIIKYVDELDASAEECGAVNIVSKKDDRLIGYNTDGEGLADSIAESGFSPEGRSVIILGRGGAAVSAACALRKRGCDVSLLVRTKGHGDFREIVIGESLDKFDFFINATPLGMAGSSDFDSFGFLDEAKPELVIDMVYLDERDTTLISEAKRRGIAAIDGAAMLRCQALRAFRIFTGIEA